MRIKSLHIKNFRALEEIDVDLESSVSVIVGPNAIGKTTLLEAIRLAKAIVAPRSPNESSQALFSLGAAAPYSPGRIISSAIARDPKRQIEIRCRYQLTTEEIDILTGAASEIATGFALKSMGQPPQNVNLNIAFLSSPQGMGLLAAAEKDIKTTLDAVRAGSRDLFLDLRFDPASSRFNSADPLGGMFFQYLDERNNPSQTTFSYFPADRALPPGEQLVQLGGADAQLQIESHASQPQLKYTRLKNTIFSAVVTSKDEREELEKGFGRIFGGILTGRKLMGVGINQLGLLSIVPTI